MPEESAAIRPSSSDTISQSEVEALPAQRRPADGSSAEPEGAWSPGRRAACAEAERHQFRQFSSFSAAEMRKLRVRHEEFVRSLAARLSIYLRLEVGLQITRLETATFQRFVETLQSPTHLSSIKLNPLDGICLLDVPTRLGLSIVDRELGGPGVCLEEARDLSLIEARLLSEVVAMVITEWCGSWNDLLDLSPVVLGYENNGRFIQDVKADEIMLVLGMDARIGTVVEPVQLALPYPVLQSLVANLKNGQPDVKPNAKQPGKQEWNAALADVEVPVTFELPKLQLTARQVSNLKRGDVLPIGADMMGQVRLCLNKVPKFVGVLGLRGQHCAVRIERKS